MTYKALDKKVMKINICLIYPPNICCSYSLKYLQHMFCFVSFFFSATKMDYQKPSCKYFI